MKFVPAVALPHTALTQLRVVYESSFPPTISATFDDLFVDQVHAYVDDTPSVLGLTVHRNLGETGWIFLRYFAAAVRGGGTGSRMWRNLDSIAGGAPRVVLDVEHPHEDGITSEEVEVRRRRIIFYERLGARVLPVDEYAPPHNGVEHPMLLLAADAVSGDNGWVDDPAEVARVVLAVYEHRYGLGEDHSVVQHTLRASGLGQAAQS